MECSIYMSICLILCSLHICVADNDLQSFFKQASEATLSEDGKLNFTQLVVKYGQSVEKHDVVTEDGYILTLFHIPGEKPPVLLFHGIADSSDTFLIKGNTSLVITLAAEGYDVWVGNNRGTLYGRRHIKLDPDTDEKFWDYSLHQIGYYDLAATIDYVRNKTGADSISTVGHSQGTTAHFVLTSLRPEYNQRIKVFLALAPVAFLNDLPPPLDIVIAAGPALSAILKTLGISELLQDNKAASNLITLVCSKGVISYVVCDLGLVFPFAGFDTKGLDKDFLTGVAFGHYPRATSRKALEHFDQIALNRRFAQYDYGIERNLAKYGSIRPPSYDLSAITMNVALFVGKADNLATIPNAKLLKDSLPNVVHYQVMEPKQWNHLDFVWGTEMPTYLYPQMLELLKKYN